VGSKSHPQAVKPADLCICAVPATRLQHFTWSPEPEEHLEAARQLQYSRITKTAVLFEQRFWPAWRSIRRRGHTERTGFAVFTNRVADFCFDSTHSPTHRSDAGILCSYSFGEKAANITSEDPQKIAQWIRGDVVKVLRALKVKAAGTGFQQEYQVIPKPWHVDEWAGGAYAFLSPRPVVYRSSNSSTALRPGALLPVSISPRRAASWRAPS
jgi:monoamine oxidase